MTTRRDVVLTPAQQSLKVATRDLVREFGGTSEAGVELGRRQQAVSDLCLPNTNCFITIEDVAALEDRTVGRTGHPHVTRALAKRQGFTLVRLAAAIGNAIGLTRSVMRMAEELGDVSREINAAEEDGHVDPTEARRVLAELEHLETEAATLRVALEHIIENGGKR